MNITEQRTALWKRVTRKRKHNLERIRKGHSYHIGWKRRFREDGGEYLKYTIEMTASTLNKKQIGRWLSEQKSG
jgi:hypothetical protein